MDWHKIRTHGVAALMLLALVLLAGACSNTGADGDTENDSSTEGGAGENDTSTIEDEHLEMMSEGLNLIDAGMHRLQEHQGDIDSEDFNRAMLRMHDNLGHMHDDLGGEMYGGMYGHMHGGMHGGMHHGREDGRYHMGMMHRHWSGMRDSFHAMHEHMMDQPPGWMRDAMDDIDQGMKKLDRGMNESGAAEAGNGKSTPESDDLSDIEADHIEAMNRGMGMMDEAMRTLKDHEGEIENDDFYHAMMMMHDGMWGMHHHLGYGMYWCMGDGMHGMMHQDMYRAHEGRSYPMHRMHRNWRHMHDAWDRMNRHMGEDAPQWMREAMQKFEEGLKKVDEGAEKAGVDEADEE